jgi:hypothetical protein
MSAFRRLHQCLPLAKQSISQHSHIVTDFTLSDLGVYLRRPDALMPQELAHRFNWYIIFQGNGCRKGIAGRMGG